MIRVLVQRRRSRTAVLLQLAAFVLLQLSLLLPPVARALTLKTGHAVCQGDHKLCGCDPARVAAGTCCCAMKSLPPCCKKKAEEKAAAEKLHNVIHIPPCGSSAPMTVEAVETFMPAFHAVPKIFSVVWNYLPHPPGPSPNGRLQPPVPPPETLLYA